jgi:hypothetical protein
MDWIVGLFIRDNLRGLTLPIATLTKNSRVVIKVVKIRSFCLKIYRISGNTDDF